MNKRGSHVGMILSFVIFITFIVFLYTVVKPAVNVGEDKKTITESIQSVVMKNASENLTSVSIEINETTNPSSKCITLQNFLFNTGLVPYMIIKNEDGIKQNAYYADSDGYNLRIDRDSKDYLFFKIFYLIEILFQSVINILFIHK